MRHRIVFLAGFGAGYVLGARAGRERYEQIRGAALRLRQAPAVRRATGSVSEHAGHLAHSATHAAVEGGRNAADRGRHVADRVSSSVTARFPLHVPERFGGTPGSRQRHPSGRGLHLSRRASVNGTAPEGAAPEMGGGTDEPGDLGPDKGRHNGFERD